MFLSNETLDLIDRALSEDQATNDVTSQALSVKGQKGIGRLVANANGVLAGIFPEGSIEGFRTRGPIAATKELPHFQDVDTTVEGLIDDSWKPEFYCLC